MAERNFVPRNNEGASLGTNLKRWLKGWFKDLFVESEITDGSNSTTVADIVNTENSIAEIIDEMLALQNQVSEIEEITNYYKLVSLREFDIYNIKGV